MKTRSRTYRPDDLERLIEIIKDHLHDDVVAFIGPWEQSEEMLRRDIPGNAKDIRILESQDSIVAFVWTSIQPDRLFLEEIHVVGSSKGQGLGSRLLEEVEIEARSRGLEKIHLTVFEDRPAVRFWQRVGFAICGEINRNQWPMYKRI